MEGEREREGLGGRERGEAMMMLRAQSGLARYQSRDVPPRRVVWIQISILTFVHILYKEQRSVAFLFSSRLSRKQNHNQDNHTPQGENNEHNSRPCSPITHIPPCFLPNPYLIPTQPEPDPSLAYVAAYIPYSVRFTHCRQKTLTPSNGTQSCYAVDVAQHDLCRNPVAAQKEKHLRDGIMVEQLEHAYIYRHTYTYMYGVLRPYIRKVPDVRPWSTEIMSGALQISQLSDKGREPKG